MFTTRSANNADEVPVEMLKDRDVPSSSSSSQSSAISNMPQQNLNSLPGTDVVASSETAKDPEQTSSSGSSEDDQTTSEEEESDDDDDDDDEKDVDGSEDQENTTDPAEDGRVPEVPTRTSDDLRSRLQAFLPQIQNANLALQENPANVLDRRLDDVSDSEEHYIEMNLGLGVLSERRERSIAVTGGGGIDDDDDDDDNSNSDSHGDGEDHDEGRHDDDRKGGKTVHDGGVLAALKGEKTNRGTKRKVEELG